MFSLTSTANTARQVPRRLEPHEAMKLCAELPPECFVPYEKEEGDGLHPRSGFLAKSNCMETKMHPESLDPDCFFFFFSIRYPTEAPPP